MRKSITKSIFRFLLLCIPLLVLSCQEEELILNADNNTTEETKSTADESSDESSALVEGEFDYNSVSNPDLIYNWENITEIALNKGYYATAPWTEGCSTNLPESFRKDISRLDGWTMLFHTFKNPVLADNRSVEYMVFYNFFTGVIKVFYYNHNADLASCNITSWHLQAHSGTFPKLLNIPQFISSVDTDPLKNSAGYIKFQVPSLHDFVFCGGIGWNGFEFHVGQYSTDLQDGNFTLVACNDDYSFSHGSGSINKHYLSGGLISSSQANSVSENEVHGMGDFSDYKGIDFIKALSDYSAQNNCFISSSLETIESNFNRKLDASEFENLMNSGWNSVFCRSLTYKTAHHSNYRFAAEGTYTVNSTATNNVIGKACFNLKHLLQAQLNKSLADMTVDNGYYGSSGLVVPLTDADSRFASDIRLENLGTWTVQDSINAYWDLVSMASDTHFEDEASDLIVNGTFELPHIADYDINVVFNPFIEQFINSSQVEVEFRAYAPDSHLPTGVFNPRERFFNLMYRDNVKSMYKLPADGTRSLVKAMYYFERGKTVPQDGEPVFLKWNLPNYKVVAVVTVTMNVTYRHNNFTVKEHRIYPVRNIEKTENCPNVEALTLNSVNSWLINMAQTE